MTRSRAAEALDPPRRPPVRSAEGRGRRAGLIGTLGTGALVIGAPLEGIPPVVLLEALGAWVPWPGAALAGGALALGAVGAAVALLYRLAFEAPLRVAADAGVGPGSPPVAGGRGTSPG